MKAIKQLHKSRFDGMEELKLSLLIHLAILLALSAFFAWRSVSAEPAKPPVVAVKLIAPIAKPRAGAPAPAQKNIGSKKAAGSEKRVVKKAEKKPVRKVKKAQKAPVRKPKTEKAPVQKKAVPVKEQETVKKPEQKIEPRETPVIAQVAAEEVKPVVINEPVAENKPVKPTHSSPSFETISHLSLEKSRSSEILTPELSNPMTTTAIPMLMPEFSDSDDKLMSSPEDFINASTGTESSDDNRNSGVFEIGAIEAFGGTNERFSPPAIISRVTPDYPAWARRKGVHGSAVYRVLIQQSGTVGDVVTMSSTIDPKLAIDGAQALRRWVFSPVLANGEPQETWIKITVQYKLN